MRPLRQQLIVVRRQIRPRLRGFDRWLIAALAGRFHRLFDAVLLVKPDTVIRWHRSAWRLLWRWRSRSRRPPGRPPIEADLRELIRRMWRQNPTWGQKIIAAQLAKLGYQVSPRTVAKYRPAGLDRKHGQRWTAFIRNHLYETWACDFFVLVTARFHLLYVFVLLSLGRRRIVHAGVTAHPNARWAAQRIAEATSDAHHIPRFLVRDRDSIYGVDFCRRVRGLGTRLLATPPRSSKANPAQSNKAILGALVNSTPIDVGQPGDSPMPGGDAFYLQWKNRPHLTYVGSDDGLLHAFWSQNQTVGGVAKPGGSEAFAYLPPEMLRVVTTLYAQGGQIPDPTKHIYGLASSPKVKNLCVSNCAYEDTAVWRTELVMTDGFGGTEAFALDITDPTASAPLQVLWSTINSSSKSTYDAGFGLTISIPAFYLNKTTALDDYRLLMASGYRSDLTSAGAGQGLSVFSISAGTGGIQTRATVSPPGGPCGQECTMLTDVATAKDYTKNSSTGVDERQKLLAGYAGDTWGTLWQFDGTATPKAVASLGCNNPLHFSPTVGAARSRRSHQPPSRDLSGSGHQLTDGQCHQRIPGRADGVHAPAR